MPIETQDAVNWALGQVVVIDDIEVPVTKDTTHELVDKVREYFNTHGISYETFSYDDLVPYLN